jgi:paraquat-inducible protein B
MKKGILILAIALALSGCVNSDPKNYQIESLESVFNNDKLMNNINKLSEEEQGVVKDYLEASQGLKNLMNMAQRAFPPEEEKYLLEYPITIEKILLIHTEVYKEKKRRDKIIEKYGLPSFSHLSNDAEDLREQNKELIDELMTQNLETLTRQNRTESEPLKRELQQTIKLYRALIQSASRG